MAAFPRRVCYEIFGKSEPLFETRYVIADDDGKILDDAQGYGYKTAQKANKDMWWKFKKGKETCDSRVLMWKDHIDLLRKINRFLYDNAKEICIGDITDEEIFNFCKEISKKDFNFEIPDEMLKFALSRTGSKMLNDKYRRKK